MGVCAAAEESPSPVRPHSLCKADSSAASPSAEKNFPSSVGDESGSIFEADVYFLEAPIEAAEKAKRAFMVEAAAAEKLVPEDQWALLEQPMMHTGFGLVLRNNHQVPCLFQFLPLADPDSQLIGAGADVPSLQHGGHPRDDHGDVPAAERAPPGRRIRCARDHVG